VSSDRLPVSATTRSAISRTVSSPGLPTFMGPAWSLKSSASRPVTVSSTKQTDLVCRPSPETVTG
jgi:hypothetical protein